MSAGRLRERMEMRAMTLEEVIRESDYLRLSTAAAVAYHQITGSPPDAPNLVQLDAILNRIAAAISAIVPVYSFDTPSGEPRALSSPHVTSYRGLSVRRADMEKAISALRRAPLAV